MLLGEPGAPVGHDVEPWRLRFRPGVQHGEAIPTRVQCSRLRDQIDERPTFDEFHDQRTQTVRLFQAMQRCDVGVVERRQHLRLTAESRDRIGIVQQLIGQQLQRDIPIEPRVAGAIDLPMPPAPVSSTISYGPTRDPGMSAIRSLQTWVFEGNGGILCVRPVRYNLSFRL